MVSREIAEKIPIEPEAGLLVSFVNTRDLEQGTDSIAGPEALNTWATEHVGTALGGAVSAAEHAELLALRESLRALLRANNNGGEASAAELAPLREAVARARYASELSPGGRLELVPAGSGGAGGALSARLLLAIERVQAQGAWARLKACPAEDCQWAFYDGSRNRSRTWCSMEECGNREKTRRYRSRKASS